MRSGHINVQTGRLRNAGNEGNYWSSRAYSSETNAYDFNFNTGMNPSNNGNRWVGRSLRCLFSAVSAPIYVLAIDNYYHLCYNGNMV